MPRIRHQCRRIGNEPIGELDGYESGIQKDSNEEGDAGVARGAMMGVVMPMARMAATVRMTCSAAISHQCLP
jgi:hypothetical protein